MVLSKSIALSWGALFLFPESEILSYVIRIMVITGPIAMFQ